MDTRKENTVVVFHTSIKVLQSKPRSEKAFDRRTQCDSHMCKNTTVWIISVVNPTLEEGFAESSIRFYTVGHYMFVYIGSGVRHLEKETTIH